MEVDGPDDALSRVVLQNGGGELDSDLLEVLDSVLLHVLLPRQLGVVNIGMLQLCAGDTHG